MKKELSRRKFIGTAALGAGAAILPSNVSASDSAGIDEKTVQNLPPLKLGLMTYLIGSQWDLDTIIKNCTQTKYLQAELRTGQKHGVEISLNKAQRQEVKQKVADSALESIALASAYSYHHPDQSALRADIEGTKQYLQLAADVGAVGIRVFPNDLPDAVPEEKTMEQIGKSLAEVGKVGHDLGVEVRVCIHGRKTTQISVIKKILDYSQSPHVYLNWNCGQDDTRELGLQGNYDLLKDRITGVHLHDLDRENYPYRDFFQLLRLNGYKGFCNCEVSRVSCEPIEFMRSYRALFLALQNVI